MVGLGRSGAIPGRKRGEGMVITVGRTELRIIDNRPVWALAWGWWRFERDQDVRLWFWRARIGPLKLEAVRCCHRR